MKGAKIKIGRSLLSFFMVFTVVCSFTVVFAKNPVEIDLWNRWAGQQDKMLQEIIDNFMAKHPEITVKNVTVTGAKEYTDLEAKVLAKLAAGGEPPALVATGYNFLEHAIATFNPMRLEKLPGAEAVFGRYLPATLKLGQVNGEQWGLPFALSNPVLFYNGKIFEDAGLDPDDPPRTWKEVYLMAKIIKDKTTKAPVWIEIINTYLPQSLIGSNGGHLLEGGRAAFNSPEAIEAMEMWQRLYREELAPKVKFREGMEALQAGNIAMVGTSPSWLKRLIPALAAVGGECRVAKLPTFGCKPRKLASGGAFLMILAEDPERRKATWELMKYMVSEEGMATWVKTGYISPLDPAKFKPPITDYRQKPAYEQLFDAVRWVNWPGKYSLEVEKIFLDAMDKMLFEGMNVEKVLNEAVERANVVIRG